MPPQSEMWAFPGFQQAYLRLNREKWAKSVFMCTNNEPHSPISPMFFQCMFLRKVLRKSLHQINEAFLNHRIVCTVVLLSVCRFCSYLRTNYKSENTGECQNLKTA